MDNIATISEIHFKISFFSVSLRGNALRQGSSWRGSRGIVALLLVTLSVCGAAVWLYMTSLDSDITETLVSQAELVSPQPRVYAVQCSEDYENYKRYPGEAPVHALYCVGQSAHASLLCKHDLDGMKPSLFDKYHANPEASSLCWILLWLSVVELENTALFHTIIWNHCELLSS